MGLILRRREFKEDAFQIWSYIAKDNPSRADSFLGELERKFQLLSDQPYLGTKRLPSFPEFRVFPHKSYLIVYQPREAGIELIRLLHGARDWRRLFESE